MATGSCSAKDQVTDDESQEKRITSRSLQDKEFTNGKQT